jgi:DNA replicative helicase MCM subunit Mcm2 (Cdc46/Mcm family)
LRNLDRSTIAQVPRSIPVLIEATSWKRELQGNVVLVAGFPSVQRFQGLLVQSSRLKHLNRETDSHVSKIKMQENNVIKIQLLPVEFPKLRYKSM